MLTPTCMLICVMTDYYKMVIPNSVCAVLIVLFPAIALFFGMQWLVIFENYVAALLVLFCILPLYVIGKMGAGDVKLLASSAVWFGFDVSLVMFLLLMSIIGALLTISILVLRGYSQILSYMRINPPEHIMGGKKIPYGIAIGIAGLIVYPHAPVMKLAIHQLASL